MRITKIVALTIVFVIASAGYASARDDIQTLGVVVTPSKLDKKKYKAAKIAIDIDTVADLEVNPNLDQPPSADRTRLDFPKNLKFDTTAVPNCKATEAALQNTTTETAKSLCGSKSIVSLTSGTDAEVTIDPDPVNPEHGAAHRRRRRHRVQRIEQEADLPALARGRGQQHVDPRRQADEGPVGVRDDPRRDDSRPPRRRDQRVPDDGQGEGLRLGSLQAEDGDLPGSHRLREPHADHGAGDRQVQAEVGLQVAPT